MSEIPKNIKKLIYDYAAIAHDRELGQALQELRADFDRWKKGDISPIQLNNQIHDFHQGPSREFWKKYGTQTQETALAAAIVTGILPKGEVPDELLQYLEPLIEFYEVQMSK